MTLAVVVVAVAPTPVLGGIPGTPGKEGVARHPGKLAEVQLVEVLLVEVQLAVKVVMPTMVHHKYLFLA